MSAPDNDISILSGDRLLRLSDVVAKVAMGKTTVYAMIKQGTFPRPMEIAPQLVRWRASDIDAWISQLRAAAP